ncbi:MAG: hypothetical protein CL824_02390 [Crocinitomicaceae bacterium]|nr:hypothetical protein [Crocinitomicaceae bacterium]
MKFLGKNLFFFFTAIIFIGASIFFSFKGLYLLLIILPLGLLVLYTSLYQTKYLFLSLALLTPLSINIEEYTEGFGLFLPTEPILFGLMILYFFYQINSSISNTKIWKHPIIVAAIIYFSFVLIASFTSSAPLVSFKFLLSKLWFFVPMVLFGSFFFRKKENIRYFLYLFVLGCFIAIVYTLSIHASYNFGEKEGHWVMWPFFKDHTVYGAIIALVLPLAIGLLVSKKHSALNYIHYLFIIIVIIIGLYFSYTRAAWLSIIVALFILLLIYYRVKFSYIASFSALFLITVLLSWDSIQMEMERNKYEHTTEEFGERIQSAANITTDASNLERLNRWECAIEMFKEKPLLGFGPGTYAFEYARFQRPENLTIISTNFGNMGNAHSEYLSALSENGIFGFISFIGLVSAIFYSAITLFLAWPKEDQETRILILSIILSLSTYFFHAILNNFLDTDKAAVPIWAMCSIIIALKINLGRYKKEVS